MVNAIHASTQNAEDAVERLITFKIIVVLTVDSRMRKSENIIGLRRQLKEEEQVSEELNIYASLQEKPATVSDSILPPRSSREETCN